MHTISYLLSPEGQKKSLLAGGSGAKVQFIPVTQSDSFFKEYLGYAKMDKNGAAFLGLSVNSYGGEEEIVIGYVVKETTLHFSKGELSQRAKSTPDEVSVLGYTVEKVKAVVVFDEPQTAHDILQYLTNLQYHLIASKAEAEQKVVDLQPVVDERLSEALIKLSERMTARAAKEERRFLVEAAHDKEKELFEAEKVRWSMANGSDRLRKGVEQGHPCHRLYAMERVKLDFPKYILDFDGEVRESERIAPQLHSLEAVEHNKSAGLDSEVVHLKSQCIGQYPEEIDIRCGEYVVIRKFLGRYDIFLPTWMDDDE